MDNSRLDDELKPKDFEESLTIYKATDKLRQQLAAQEQHVRVPMQEDNYDDRRASLVKDWALRQAAASSKS